jgi:hypothetical protein
MADAKSSEAILEEQKRKGAAYSGKGAPSGSQILSDAQDLLNPKPFVPGTPNPAYNPGAGSFLGFSPVGVALKAAQAMRGPDAGVTKTELLPPVGVQEGTQSSASIPGSAEQEEQLLQHQTPIADSGRALSTQPVSSTTSTPRLSPVSEKEAEPFANWMGNTTVPTSNVPQIAQSLPRDPNKLKQTAEKVAQAMKQAKGTESEGFWRSIFQVVAGVADVAAKGLYGYGGREYTTQAERQLEQARQMAMLQAQQGFQAGESALDRSQTTSNIKLTGEQNANMQLAGHKFEAEQNRLDREFQKAQAEIQMAFQNRQMTQVEKNQQEQALIDWYNAETARNESEYRIWLSAGQPAGGFDFKGAAMEDTVSGGR